jgi:hypothetical protein
MKTGIQIQTDLIALLSGSALADAVNGAIYHAGCRPAASTTEDLAVAFAEGTVGDIEIGTVVVSIFVPDAQNTVGTQIQNIERCAALEAAAALWVESLTAGKSDYRFALQSTICTQAAPQINQHFISIKLTYEYM